MAAVILFAAAGVASAAPPSAPTILEPLREGVVLNPGDVHMEATGFEDPDGDAHECSDWEIIGGPDTPDSPEWDAPCARGPSKLHIHLPDGEFHPDPEHIELHYETDYLFRVRFIDSSGEASPWSERRFRTQPPGPPGRRSAVPWAPRQRGYKVELVASGLQLPVKLAMVPNPRPGPRAPLLYVTELYGDIKVVRRNGTIKTYARNVLNFNPADPSEGGFRGGGQVGLTGLAVEPRTGDLFTTMTYQPDPPDEDGQQYAKVVRFRSSADGRRATGRTTVLDIPELQGPSHIISNVSIGPDRKLYVHVADGLHPEQALNLESFLGKVLRVNLDGSAPANNPFHDASDGITPRDYVYAYGMRNPFGGAWRAADDSLYLVDVGPLRDRFARLEPGMNLGFDGTNSSMSTHALYNWEPAHVPLDIAFVQRGTAGNSGFAAQKMDHAFVTESGSTWASGPQYNGKRIAEFKPNRAGRYQAAPRPFVEYTGVGKATAAGLAAAPEGLYFTDLYKDVKFDSPTDRGAKVWLVRETRRPRISRLRFKSRHARVSYVASESAVVSTRIRQLPGGRRVRFGARLSDIAGAGSNRFRLTGARKRLEPGRYVLILRARDLAGNRSRPTRIRFRIA